MLHTICLSLKHGYYDFNFIIIIDVYVCACLSVCIPWRPEEGSRSPETGVTGGCELSDVGKQTWVFWEIRKSFYI